MNTEIPLSVARYLRSISYEGKAFAYMKLDAGNRVMESGGNPEYFGMEIIDSLRPVDEQFLSLSGLLPVSDVPVVIAYTQIGSDHFIDIHLYCAIDGQWVVMLDNTEAGKKLQYEQQIRLSNDILNEAKSAS